jgi:hypothetical protein
VSHSYQTYFGFPGSDLNLDCRCRDHMITRFTSTCHPQIGGQTEVVNRTLTQLMCAIIQRNFKNWEDCLPFTEFAYNRSLLLNFHHLKLCMDLTL